MKIVLGTAHLDVYSGKHSPDYRLREAVYSRQMVAEVKAILADMGYEVYVDYEPLKPCAAMKAMSQSKIQSRELSYRVKQVNALCDKFGAKNVMYVSLHNDAIGNDCQWHDCGGFSVWTSVGQTQGDKIAECIYDAWEKNAADNYIKDFAELQAKGVYGKKQRATRMDMSDGDRDKEAGYYVLTQTKCAACLVEMLFQDNKSDVAFLLSDVGRQVLCRTIVEGIINYIEKYGEQK